MDGTTTSILFNQYYYDEVTPAKVDSAKITVGTESDWTSIAATQDSYMSFSTVDDGTLDEAVRIISDGNVGIGVTAPTAKLHLAAPSSGYTSIITCGYLCVRSHDDTTPHIQMSRELSSLAMAL